MKFPTLPSAWLVAECYDQASADAAMKTLWDVEESTVCVVRATPIAPVDLQFAPMMHNHFKTGRTIDPPWILERVKLVIVSGEVGPDARPLHPDWVRAIRDQCVAAGVPFWFAGWGEWAVWQQLCFGNQWAGREAFEHEQRPGGSQTYFGYRVVRTRGGGVMTGTTPGLDPLSIAKIGATLSGRLLDGRTWNELPEGANAQV